MHTKKVLHNFLISLNVTRQITDSMFILGALCLFFIFFFCATATALTLLHVLALNAARTSLSEWWFRWEINVLLRVQTNDEWWNVHNLLANATFKWRKKNELIKYRIISIRWIEFNVFMLFLGQLSASVFECVVLTTTKCIRFEILMCASAIRLGHGKALNIDKLISILKWPLRHLTEPFVCNFWLKIYSRRFSDVMCY